MGRRSTRCFLLVTIISGAWGLCFPTCSNSSGLIAEGAKVPDPSDCTQYYVCSDTDGVGDLELSDDPLTCADGMYFNKASANCATIPLDGSPYCDMCNPCDVDCSVPGVLVPNPYDCQAYYVCLDNGGFITAVCQDDGYQFDFEKGDCFPEGEARCFKACDPCQIYCVEEGRLPDPFDCTAYLYCEPDSGTAHFQCPDTDYYNAADEECQELTGDSCVNACIVQTTSTTLITETSTTEAAATTSTTGGSGENDYDRHN